MTEIQFEFREFTLKQCEILYLINHALGIHADPHIKLNHLELVHSRFTGPRRDKHWDGIKQDFVRLFSELREEISDEQWRTAPEYILSFIEGFAEYEVTKAEYDEAVRNKLIAENLVRQKWEAETKAKRLAAEAKAKIDTVKKLGSLMAEETAERKRLQNVVQVFCPGCGQLLPPYSECYC
jgi:hypothetical protein